MTNILQQIQADVLNQNVSLSNTLRKAKVLASQLRSQELSNWVSSELDGYKSEKDLPDYRVIRTHSVGKWTNGAWLVTNQGVPLYKITDEKLVETLTTLQVHEGIRTVEQYAAKQEYHFVFAPEITALVNHYVSEGGYVYSEIQLAIGAPEFEQILDTVKNRLLDFVLKLDETWNPADNPPPRDRLSELVSMVIYNNIQGGNMSVFDQRGQQVTYQYNAAGNINIDSVQDNIGLATELEKLVEEIESAKEARAIDKEIAVEAEYHVQQSAKEAKSKRPNKGSILEHIGKAKALLDDVAAVAGLVTALLKAAEVASNILR